MKTTLLKLAAVVFAASSLFSCATSQRITTTARESDGRIYEPYNMTPFTKPLTAEVEVLSQERIADVWEFDLTPSKKERKILLSGGSLPANLKAQAIAKSSNKYGADMIVAALFDYQFLRESYNTTGEVLKEVVTITVTGYPAKFSNWKSVSEQDGDYKWIESMYGSKLGLSCKDSSVPNVNVTITK